jgi:hypothetical protein
MKYLLIILLALLGTIGVTKAQTITYTNMTAAGYQYKYVKIDSGLNVPNRDTTLGRGTTRPGSLVIHPADSILYIWNGVRWQAVGSTSSVPVTFTGVTSTTYDSVTRQLCVVTTATSTCYTITDSAAALTTSPDSVVIRGDEICVWKDGVPDCHIVQSTIINNTYINNFNTYNATVKISGEVVYDSLLVFHGTPFTYYINGVYYTSDLTYVTLDDPLPSVDRTDVFYVDSLGNFGVLTGDLTGLVPQVDPASQLAVAQVVIPSAASTDTVRIGNLDVYKENVEWVGSSSLGTVNFDYPTNAYEGAKSIYIPSYTNNTYLRFLAGATYKLSDVVFVKMRIRLTTAFRSNNRDYFSIKFQHDTIKRTNFEPVLSGTYGFDRTIVGSWQEIVIPIAEFVYGTPDFNEMYFNLTGTGTFQLDNIILQTGTQAVPINVGKYVETVDGKVGPHVVLNYPDTLTQSADSSTIYLKNKLTGVTWASTPTYITYLRSADTCLIIDTIDSRNFTIELNPYCIGGGGGGSTDTTSLSNRINAKQDALSGTGIVKSTAGVISYLTDPLPVANGGTGTTTPTITAGTNITSVTGTWPNVTINAATQGGGGGGIDSVRRQIGTDSIKQYSGGTGTIAFRDQRVFHVKDYGATGNGVTDDRAAIQLAINAAYTARGGVIYFPNGIYVIGGALVNGTTVGIGAPNSQLYIPYDSSYSNSTTNVHLEFRGESGGDNIASGLASYGINRSGVILYSTITGSGSFPSILGTYGSTLTADLNPASVMVKNMNFRVKANIASGGPTMSAINFSRMGFAELDYVICDIDTSSNRAVYPTIETVGIYLPLVNNGASIPISNTLVQGYKYGYILSEHASGNNVNAMVCEHAFVFTQGGHASAFGRLLAQWCNYVVSGPIGTVPKNSNRTRVKIEQLDVEYQGIAFGDWFYNKYIVYDSLNYFYGDINYHLGRRGFGADKTGFNRLGGTNLNCNPLDSGLATRGPNIFRGMQTTQLATGDTLHKFLQSTTLLGSIRKPTSANLLFSNNNFSNADPTSGNYGNGAVMLIYNGGIANYMSIGISAIRNTGYDMTFSSGAGSVAGGFRWYNYGTEAMSLTRAGNLLMGTTTDVTQSILTLSSTTKGILIPRMTRAQAALLGVGGISTATTTNAGSGGANGTYGGSVYTTVSGSGAGAAGTVVVAGGVLSTAAFNLGGYGYQVGDVVSTTAGGLTGVLLTVTALTGSSVAGLKIYNTTTNSDNTFNGTSLQGDFIVSAAATLSLAHGADYVFTGTTSTWTLPAISASLLGRNNAIEIKNRGSGTITLNTRTGSSTIYNTAAVATINIVAGAACRLMPDGTYHLVQFNQ